MKKILCALLGLILTLPGFAACPSGQVEQTYTSATGTVTQNGTPTPEHPVEPVFYTQGNMTLRAVGYGDNIVADTYDATTGKITRNVNSYTFTGNESFTTSTAYGEALIITAFDSAKGANRNVAPVCNYFLGQPTTNGMQQENTCFFNGSGHFYFRTTLSAADFKTWLAARYAEGNPVIAYFARSTSTTTDWNETTYCATNIKIATTAYNTARFSPVVTELNDTIATIRNVVTNTINQTKAIADLQATKQTRPDENCPAGKKCLLVEDNDGQPHWYEIIESAPGIVPAGSGYTQVEYLQSDGNQWIDTGFEPNINSGMVLDFESNRSDGPIQAMVQNGTITFGVSSSSSVQTTDFLIYNGVGNDTNLYWRLDNAYGDGTGRYLATIDKQSFSVKASNGATYSRTVSNAAYTIGYNLVLFGRNAAGTKTGSKVKIYSAQLYDDGVMVRDFVPARRNSDGVLGMYDTISGTFFTNAGSGTFTAGPDI